MKILYYFSIFSRITKLWVGLQEIDDEAEIETRGS